MNVQTNDQRPKRPNYAVLHARPLPLDIYPLPVILPHNPISVLQVAWTILRHYFFPPSSHPPQHEIYHGYYDATTRSVHVTDPEAIRAFWERGFFGKGSLSRSEPEWLERERRRLGKLSEVGGLTSAEVTNRRRAERKEEKRERARKEREELEAQLRSEGKLLDLGLGDDQNLAIRTPVSQNESIQSLEINGSGDQPRLDHHNHDMHTAEMHSINNLQEAESVSEQASIINQEHLQLTPVEAFFLTYGLGILQVTLVEDQSGPGTKTTSDNATLLRLFRKSSTFPTYALSGCVPADDSFMISYAVYHHFRSLGWVVRPGLKFAVDFLLYNRGPVFAHAEFAVLIIPSYRDDRWRKTEKRRIETEKKEAKHWWWLHAANRVQTQVRKSLILAYVDIPPPESIEWDVSNDKLQDIGSMLRKYSVKEFCLKRWSPNRNRD